MANVNKKSKEINIEKVNEIVNTSNKILKILFTLLIVIILYVSILILKEWEILSTIVTILKVISPLFIGFVIAWLLNPVVNDLSKRGMRRNVAVFIVYAVLLIFIYLFCLAVIPVLTEQINDIVSSIPGIVSNIRNWINDLFNNLSDKTLINLNDTKAQLFESIDSFGK